VTKPFSFNPYLKKTNRSIVYKSTPTADGWRVEALLPTHISPSDKVLILTWFDEYRRSIRSAHPQWVTVFHPAPAKYVLEIRKMNSDKEIVQAGEDLKDVCGEVLEYA
jgi:hypothetical protein